MDKFKSRYERLLDKLEQDGKIVKLSEEDNMLIMKELNEGMAEFVNEQRTKERHSELELSSIVLI